MIKTEAYTSNCEELKKMVNVRFLKIPIALLRYTFKWGIYFVEIVC